jgi:hypothetical protein
MEMFGSHTEKTAGKHNLSGLVVESPREERKRNLRQIKRAGMSWKDLDKIAFYKMAWRDMVIDQCLHGGYRVKK